MHSSHFPKLELKYCERCGGLWLRPQGGEEVYCDTCRNAIQELPPVKPKSPKAEKARHMRSSAAPPDGAEGTMGGTWA